MPTTTFSLRWGGVPAGLGDVGGILVAVQIAPGGDAAKWTAAFTELAQRVQKLAEAAKDAGDRRSARDAYLRAAFDHGFNALIFDGPGQQSMLLDRGIPFRPDWEAVITPVVDFLLLRPDVDADALVLWGGSQGGFWGARALAFEKRLAAAFLDPGVVDVSTSWLSHFPPEFVALLDSGDRDDVNAGMAEALKSPELARTWTFRARPYAQDSPYDVLTAMRTDNVKDLAHQITTPVMIADPEGEQFWPGQSAQLAGLIGEAAVLQKFTAAEGADMHCEPMARSLVHQRMYTWLQTVLPSPS